MRRLRALLIVATASGVMSSAATRAIAEPKDMVSIADNDSVYIDGRSFNIVPGKDVSLQIKMLDAHDLGPGAIVFRSGDKLWIANAAPVVPGMSDRYGSDRRDYGSDRYGSDRRDYGSDRYGSDRRDYGSDRYGSDRRDYGSDRYGADQATQRVYISDPEYAQFRLRKAFEDNWTAAEPGQR